MKIKLNHVILAVSVILQGSSHSVLHAPDSAKNLNGDLLGANKRAASRNQRSPAKSPPECFYALKNTISPIVLSLKLCPIILNDNCN